MVDSYIWAVVVTWLMVLFSFMVTDVRCSKHQKAEFINPRGTASDKFFTSLVLISSFIICIRFSILYFIIRLLTPTWLGLQGLGSLMDKEFSAY
jgi:hypothetical protein